MNKSLLTIASLIALATVPAAAQLTVGGTYNTGYDGSTAIAPGGQDTDFSIIYAAGPVTAFSPYVPNAGEIPGGWVTVPGAQFISPSANESYPPTPYEGGLPGIYYYQASIANNFLVPTEITISGSYAADNTVEIEAGGMIEVPFAASSPDSEFAGPLIPFSFTLTANVGSTTIDFDVINYNSDNSDPFAPGGSDGNLNPVGLLVKNLTITASPEPSTWAMMGLGLLALFAFGKLRKLTA